MSNLAVIDNRIPAMSDRSIGNVYELENIVLSQPQIPVPTQHVLHGGMYARTIMIPAGIVLTGALIKVATTLVVSGEVIVYIGDTCKKLIGYNVFAASSNRKQAFVAITDTYLTMVFPSKVKTIEEAEMEFTDDFERLMSRQTDAVNHYVITGE